MSMTLLQRRPSLRRRLLKAAGGAVLLALLLVLLNHDRLLSRNPVTGALVEAVTLPVRLVDRSGEAVRNGWDRYIDLREVRELNGELQAEMERYNYALQRLSELEAENGRLRDLLNFAQEESLDGLAARVFATGLTPSTGRVLLDRGRNDGLRPGQPVVSPNGVVGHLGTVLGPRESELIYLTDPESRVEVLIGPNRIRGLAAGTGRAVLHLLYVEWDQPVHEGDEVVTSGMAGIFPRGLRVGRVLKVQGRGESLFQDVVVETAATLEHTEEVIILPLSQPPVGPLDQP